MEKVYSVKSEADLAVLRSLFDAAGIPYTVQNDAFGSILTGPQIDNYNTKSIMVPAEFIEQAHEIVGHYESVTESSAPVTSLRDRIRMTIEAVLFSWFAPGRARSSIGSADERH